MKIFKNYESKKELKEKLKKAEEKLDTTMSLNSSNLSVVKKLKKENDLIILESIKKIKDQKQKYDEQISRLNKIHGKLYNNLQEAREKLDKAIKEKQSAIGKLGGLTTEKNKLQYIVEQLNIENTRLKRNKKPPTLAELKKYYKKNY